MKTKTLITLILLLTLSMTLFYGCADTTTEQPAQEIPNLETPTPERPTLETPAQIIKDISAEDAYNLIEENQNNPNFMIIDVRTPEEYTGGHIENSMLININGDDFEAKIGELDKDEKYLVYCLIGGRSRSAVNYMREQGFQEVYNMLGGIGEWRAAGFPTEQ